MPPWLNASPKSLLINSILLLSVSICIFMSFQYVFRTTFPMGGDSVRYVVRAQESRVSFSRSMSEGLTHLKKSSAYPPAILLLAATKLPSVSWPDHFVWWMAAAHALVGFSLLLFLHKLSGWQAATVGILLWSMTATINHHFVNGILAHLLSLSFLLLFFHQLISKRYTGIILTALAAATFHFMTGLVLLITLLILAISQTQLTSLRSLRRQYAWVSVLGGVILILAIYGIYFLLIRTNMFILEFPIDKHSVPVFLFKNTPLAPFFVFLPVGVGALAIGLYKPTPGYLAIFFFALASILLTFNDLLEISLQVRRFESYYLLTLILLVSLSIPHIFNRLTNQAHKYCIGILLAGLLTTQLITAWQNDAQVYAFHELPNHARIHSGELAAIKWIGENLSSSYLTTSTQKNRNTEWIMVLTDTPWHGEPITSPLFTTSGAVLDTYITNNEYTHLILLKQRETLAETFHGSQELYPIVFENEGAIIIELKQ